MLERLAPWQRLRLIHQLNSLAVESAGRLVFQALENATCINAQDFIAFGGIRPIAHQPPDGGKLTAEVQGRHRMPCGKHDDLDCAVEERIDTDGKGFGALA